MIKIILLSLLAILPRAGYGETLNRTHRLGEPKRQSIHFASWLNDSTVVYCREDGTLANDLAITQVVMVHNETTTGMMNPLAEVAAIVKGAAKIFLVDSMSTRIRLHSGQTRRTEKDRRHRSFAFARPLWTVARDGRR